MSPRIATDDVAAFANISCGELKCSYQRMCQELTRVSPWSAAGVDAAGAGSRRSELNGSHQSMRAGGRALGLLQGSAQRLLKPDVAS